MLFVHVAGRSDAWVYLPQKIGAERLALEVHAQAAALVDECEALFVALMPHDRPGVGHTSKLIEGIVLIDVRVGQAVVDNSRRVTVFLPTRPA